MDDLRAAIHESWSRAVLAASTVEEHAQALVGTIGERAALAPEQAKHLAADFAVRIEEHRKTLTGEVQRAVRTAVERVRLPARTDLKKMSEKLDALEARLGQIERNARKGE